MNKIILLSILLFVCQNTWGVQKLSLNECEKAAINNSHILKAFTNDFKAAQSAASAFKTSYYPQIKIEASAKYITEIPELNGIKLNDNLNYSAGLALYWTLFDFNFRQKNYTALINISESQKQLIISAQENVLLEVRTAYFKLIGALSALKFTNEQLSLSIKQNTDIKTGLKYGVKTKIDEALSDADVLRKRKQKAQAQIMAIEAIIQLNHLTDDIIRAIPLSIVSENNINDILELETTSHLLNSYTKFLESDFDENSPQAKSFEFLSKAYSLIAESKISASYPTVNISAKTSIDYPNGPITENINQNAVSASISFPLFQFSKSNKEAAQNEFKAQSYSEQKEQILAESKKIFEFSKIKTAILLSQISTNKAITEQTKSAAELMYKAYLSGNAKFLDVDTLNIMVMQAQVEEVNTDIEILIGLSVIKSLAAISKK
jgi:outer membrane protein TolC